MPAIIPAELEKKIIKRLEDDDNRNDIILELCESQGLDWNEAESIVDSIQAEHEVDITLTQSPLLVFLALVITGNQYFGLFILSIAMIVGSLRGMQDVWAAIFAKLGLFQNGP